MTKNSRGLHIGIDLGGTKIAGVLLDAERQILAQAQFATPQGDYSGTVAAIARLVEELEATDLVASVGPTQAIPVGVGTPGVRLPDTGLMTSCNSTCLNGRPLQEDLALLLKRRIRLANDADCLALSEWQRYQMAGELGQHKLDGTLFGVILGTGVGGGWVHEGHLLAGPNGLAGEWGHMPLPYLGRDTGLRNPCFELELKLATRHCYCGHKNCVETFLSGPGLQSMHQELWHQEVSPEQLGNTWVTHHPASSVGIGQGETMGVEWLYNLSGDLTEQQQHLASMSLYLDMLARSLAQIVNVLDPQAIVLGGGLSNMTCLYDELPKRITPYLFSRDRCATQILPPLGGASSGVFGAAALVGYAGVG